MWVAEEMEEIPWKEPAAAPTNLIREDGLESLPLRHEIDEVREINP